MFADSLMKDTVLGTVLAGICDSMCWLLHGMHHTFLCGTFDAVAISQSVLHLPQPGVSCPVGWCCSADIPMLVAGDFNSVPGSAAHSLLVKGRVEPAQLVGCAFSSIHCSGLCMLAAACQHVPCTVPFGSCSSPRYVQMQICADLLGGLSVCSSAGCNNQA
jgi:hypothetical protein